MLSLAPFRYRQILAGSGGPISRVSNSGKLRILGCEEFQSSAYLRPELKAEKPSLAVFGASDGNGSSADLAVSQHKAISEALERWAYLEVTRNPHLGDFGFSYDRTSNGMAAFPGFKFQARAAARAEALERWAILGWWGGFFDAKSFPVPNYPDYGATHIQHGRKGEVVVLNRRVASGLACYGYGTAATVDAAIRKAAVELTRAEYVVAHHRAKAVLAPITHHFERRMMHFASDTGFAEFQGRLNRPADKPAPAWKTIFDGEIPGPWSKFATVWRCCVEMPTLDFLDREKNFFFW